jgi:hypothetical protein
MELTLTIINFILKLLMVPGLRDQKLEKGKIIEVWISQEGVSTDQKPLNESCYFFNLNINFASPFLNLEERKQYKIFLYIYFLLINIV